MSRLLEPHRAQGALFWIWGFALGGSYGFDVPGLGPALFPPGVALVATIPALMVTTTSFTPRVRLLASAARCTRLLCVLAPATRLAGLDLEFARWLESPIYRLPPPEFSVLGPQRSDLDPQPLDHRRLLHHRAASSSYDGRPSPACTPRSSHGHNQALQTT